VRPIVRIGLLSVLVWVTGCQLDVCKRAEQLNTDFPTRHAACFAEGTLPGQPFDGKACSSSMRVCSRDDEQALQRYLDCVETLPVCTTDTRAAFTEKFLACASGMNQLSDGCFRP